MVREKEEGYVVYADTGGTFTDTVIVKPNGDFITGKSSTTPHDYLECYDASIGAAAENMGLSKEEMVSKSISMGYGTTVGTNIMVTRRGGPKIGLITTRGQEDMTTIMRYRAAGLTSEEGMHMATADKPEPIVPRTLIRGVSERIDGSGQVVVPLQENEVIQAVKELVDAGVDGVAVGFLWSFLNDSHEKRVCEIINEVAPGLPVSISSEVVPIIRECPRYVSTMIDLYVGLPLRALLARIAGELKGMGYRYELLVMQASGGLARAAIVKPATTLHSGPVGGLCGVEFFKDLYGIKNAVGTDIGGTSFDVAFSPERGAEFLREPLVGRFEIANPMQEIVTIGAGGGTIAWIDPNTGTLRVGPHSAGSTPGPVCYDAGGTEPTITDADVVMNRIDPVFFLGGRIKLNREKALNAIKEKIADPLNLDVYEASEYICNVIDGTMNSILGKTFSLKGVDSRETMLLSYGGAGAAHCAGYTKGIDLRKIVIPPYASVFSAFGASTADIKHRYELSPLLFLGDIPYNQVSLRFELDKIEGGKYSSEISRFNKFIDEMEEMALVDIQAEGLNSEEVSRRYGFTGRYGGQLWEIRANSPTANIKGVEDLRSIISAFEEEYTRIYAREAMIPRGGLEIISLILEITAPAVKPNIVKKEYVGSDPSSALKGERKVYFGGKFNPTMIYDLARLEVGNVVDGPSIIEAIDTTVVLPPEYMVTVDEFMNLIMEPKVRS